MTNTPFQQTGWNQYSVLRVTENHSWPQGTLVQLANDDRSDCPKFRRCDNGDERYVSLCKLEQVYPNSPGNGLDALAAEQVTLLNELRVVTEKLQVVAAKILSAQVDQTPKRVLKEGDIVKCLEIKEHARDVVKRCFTVGSMYKLERISSQYIRVVRDNEYDGHSVPVQDIVFEFVREDA
ncbi:hypothetical protein D3C85_374590 [compost metagenome]